MWSHHLSLRSSHSPVVDGVSPAGAEDTNLRQSFRLTKWYLDCVDDEGNAAIAYWAKLSWRTLSMTWQRLTLYPVGGAPTERSSVGFAPPPGRAGDRIFWSSPALSCEVECDVTAPAAQHCLITGKTGRIDWRCEAPSARTVIALGDGRKLAGNGYAERIDLTILPWRLPINELQWGRWIAADASRSVAWINWLGPAPLTLVLVDGVTQTGVVDGQSSVTLRDGAIRLGSPRLLHRESVPEVLHAIPGLDRLLRGTPFTMRDKKWCTEGTFSRDGELPVRGWAIHETVAFR